MAPKVTVIIPNYNHGIFLQQRINSVLDQTYQDYEVIILDDSSTDNSREIIENYRNHPKITAIIYNTTNSGSTFLQWAKGIELAQGEWVWIAESDDWCELNFLEVLIPELTNNMNVGICFLDSNWVDSKGIKGKDLSIYKKGFFKSGITEIKESLVKFNTIQNASSVLMKKDLVNKYIGKTVKFKSCGDWRLYIDVLQDSNIIFVGKKLNNYRWYHNNISNSAYESGLWIKEGLFILAFSDAFKIQFTNRELISIVKYWLDKPKKLKFVKSLSLSISSIFYLTIFTTKCLRNRYRFRK